MSSAPDAFPEEPQSSVRRAAVIILIFGCLASTITIAFVTTQYLNVSYAIHDLGVQVKSVSLEQFSNSSATILVRFSLINPHSTSITNIGAYLRIKLNGTVVGLFDRYGPYEYSPVTIENTVGKSVNVTVSVYQNQLSLLSQANRTGVWIWSVTGLLDFSSMLGEFSVDVTWATSTAV